MTLHSETQVTRRSSVDVVVPFVGTDADLASLAARLNALTLIDGDTLTIADNRPTAAREAFSIGATTVRFAAGRPTSYFARNRGAAFGENEWILFLDADVEPPSELIDRYFDPAPGPQVGVLGGGIYDDEPGPTAAEQYSFHRGALGHGNTVTREAFAFAQTANAAVRRAAFEAIDGFTEELRSGGDADLCFRVRAAGYTLDTRFDAKVVHRNRDSIRKFFRQYARYGSGSAWLETRYPGFSPRPNAVRVAIRVVASFVRAFLALVRGNKVDAQVRMMDGVENAASFIGRHASNLVAEAPAVGAETRPEVRT